jgi:hypothetical protein
MILPFMVVCEGTGAWKPLTETRNCSQASFVKKVSENIGEGNINVFVAFLRASWCFTCTDVQHRGFDKNPVFVPNIFSIHRHLDAKLMWFDSSFKRAVASSMDIAMGKSESNLFTFHLEG